MMRVLLLILFLLSPAFGHDGHVAQLPPGKESLDEWVSSLRSKDKTHCCSQADGYLVEIYWESDGKYRVEHDKIWYDVPAGALIEVPNLAGRAMVWWGIDDDDGGRIVRCFIPGALF